MRADVLFIGISVLADVSVFCVRKELSQLDVLGHNCKVEISH